MVVIGNTNLHKTKPNKNNYLVTHFTYYTNIDNCM